MSRYAVIDLGTAGKVRVMLADGTSEDSSAGPMIVEEDLSGTVSAKVQATVRKVVSVAVSAAPETFDEMAGTIKTVAAAFWETLHEIDPQRRPSQATISFGIALTSEAEVVIAKAGGESTLTVDLNWDLTS